MISNPYPEEVLDEDYDDGTMVENVKKVRAAVVGHKIVKAEKRSDLPASRFWTSDTDGFAIELDNGKRVILRNDGDCCAYTDLESFLLNVDKVDHVITGVGTTEEYTKWHIYADMGDVLELTVGWSSGNPFYYAYGFDITVEDVPV